MNRHVVIIGSGAIGTIGAIEALRAGLAVTLLEPGEAGGEQAASYGNAGWLSSHSVIPPASPGIWKKVPGYLRDPLGPLAIRWSHLPKALPWLLRYLASAWTPERVERIAMALRPLLIDAPRLHRTLAEEAGVPHLIERNGLIHAYTSEAEFAGEAGSWAIRAKAGITWLKLSGDELRQRVPELSPKYAVGILVEEAGQCRDPGAYIAALAAHAKAKGATLVKGRATGFRIEAGRLRAVLTETGEIACDKAVIAAGARSKDLAAAAGDRVSLETERGYHAMVQAPGVAPRLPLMLGDAKMAATPMEGGLRAAGQVEIAGLEAAPNWRRAEILRDHLLAAFPGLPRDLKAEQVKLWMGHRPGTPDGMPCLGPSSATGDIVHAFGHGHIGLVTSARTGRVVAQLLSGQAPEIPIAAFSPQRFG